MAELIDKKTTRKIIEKYFESLAPSHYYKMDLEKASAYLDAEIAEIPTTTEAEIRASAIEEFVNAIEEYYFKVVDSPFMPYLRDVNLVSEANIARVAEQLKEE